MQNIYYIMGVSGTGKSTIGQLLSEAINVPFFDGDDFHPKENIDKMATGQPLNDEDRKPWLQRLSQLAKSALENKGAIIACSALKASYREILSKDMRDQIHWVFLEGTPELILQRMQEREGHFMPPELLQSQFDTLEKPKNVITISILAAPNIMVEQIVAATEIQ